MNEATRTEIRAKLVDAFDDTCYSYRSGQINREQFVAGVKDLAQIGAPVGWEPNWTEAVYAELHVTSYADRLATEARIFRHDDQLEV